uniref:Sugar phosphate transporter domain-containing protein n=1 Tax=Alexandrium catenella TaxID=2925 RepID=A0A7S1WP33_ALECA|mmetsp:Transcript_78301/g.207818  ORF Transcript_78301/g.207818 Transcript_78301/m.207818 type:complete len:404 (+) Transcript_78301:88-1299(+)|eukprot:CAMPEP_0171160082 /NCGR_PEP_ID=MMETSP0790-20130122/3372_1 /TAXON_ID=2925 /ORGANISM="Alexandrium catenella, Strain OF101" /LENGTH=403 /DNA_ID=CAMNT_0011624601 /DNA_START=86 /DNA_END=1297 /DNA_ORIENTATION=-
MRAASLCHLLLTAILGPCSALWQVGGAGSLWAVSAEHRDDSRYNSTLAVEPLTRESTLSKAHQIERSKTQHKAPAWLQAIALVCVPIMFWAACSESVSKWAILCCYVLASLSMNVLNKEAVHGFGRPFLLVIIQMVASDMAIVLVEFKKMKIGRWFDVLRWGVVPISFAGMLGTSMWAFDEATLSAIVVLKNVLPIISFGAEKVLFDIPAKTTALMLLALLVVLGGTLIYGLVDFSCTPFGKILILVNCLFTMADRLAQTHLLKLSSDFSISVPSCMVLNNTLGILPILVLALARNEVGHWPDAFRHTSQSAWFWVAASSCCGACLGYLGLKTQKLVSGTTVLVLQNFNKTLIIVISCAAYHDVLTSVSMAGCAVSILGSLLYGYSRLPSEVATPPEKKKLAS